MNNKIDMTREEINIIVPKLSYAIEKMYWVNKLTQSCKCFSKEGLENASKELEDVIFLLMSKFNDSLKDKK